MRAWLENGCTGEASEVMINRILDSGRRSTEKHMAWLHAIDWLLNGRLEGRPPPAGAVKEFKARLPAHTFAAHKPQCLAQLPPLYRDALPFKHIGGDVGYVENLLVSLMQKFGTQGSCAEVMRLINEVN